MSDNVLIAVIAASGVVITAICVLGGAIFAYIANNRHMDFRLTKIEEAVGKLTDSFDAFKEIVNGKLSALDAEIAKLLDQGRR